MKLCKAHGISRLKYENLEISIEATENPSVTTFPQARGSANKALAVTEIASTQMQFQDAQDMASTLHLEDPVAFEAMLAENELEEKDIHRSE